MALELQVWTDGGSRGNPGQAAIGVVIEDGGGDVVWQEGRYLGSPISNNQAEYQALYAGLAKAQQLGAKQVKCRMDSQLVVEQVHGRYKVKDAGLREWWVKIQALLDQFDHWQVEYVPRAENSVADSLVNQALDRNA